MTAQLDAAGVSAEIDRVSSLLDTEQLEPRVALREAARLMAAFGTLQDEELGRRLGRLLHRLDDFAFPHMTRDWVFIHLSKATDAAIKRAGLAKPPSQIRYVLDTSAGSGNEVHLQTGARLVAWGPQNGEPGDLEEAANWFWCEGHVAIWVDVHLRSTGDQAVISLMRSRGFIVPSAKIYHRREGYPPFHIPV